MSSNEERYRIRAFYAHYEASFRSLVSRPALDLIRQQEDAGEGLIRWVDIHGALFRMNLHQIATYKIERVD